MIPTWYRDSDAESEENCSYYIKRQIECHKSEKYDYLTYCKCARLEYIVNLRENYGYRD